MFKERSKEELMTVQRMYNRGFRPDEIALRLDMDEVEVRIILHKFLRGVYSLKRWA